MGLGIIGLMNGYTMKLQIDAKVKLNKVIHSYSDLSEQALGKSWKVVVDAFMIVSQLGFAIAYLLFIGAQFDTVVCYENEVCGLSALYIALAAGVLIPVCWLKSMNMLAYFSIAANFLLFFACKFSRQTVTSFLVFIIMYYCVEN